MRAISRELGERHAVQELLRIRPDFLVPWREELCKWWEAELVEHLIEGLRKAGMKIEDGMQEGVPTKLTTPRQQ